MTETYDHQLARVRELTLTCAMRPDAVIALNAVLQRLDRLEEAHRNSQYMVCSYCNHRSDRKGRSEEEFHEEINAHVISCEKRPEAKLARVIMSICVPLGVNLDDLPQGDVDAVVAGNRQTVG